jgi:hypothetical protein
MGILLAIIITGAAQSAVPVRLLGLNPRAGIIRADQWPAPCTAECDPQASGAGATCLQPGETPQLAELQV